VHALPQFFFQSPQFRLPPLAHRLSQHREVSFPRFRTAVRKAQEVKRLRFAGTSLSSVGVRKAAKLDDACFVGMQLKPEPCESLTQFRPEPFCLSSILKSRNKVIGKTHENHLPARSLLPPLLDPKVE
jgi:hypothetical protein